jgi:hypothetical protein
MWKVQHLKKKSTTLDNYKEDVNTSYSFKNEITGTEDFAQEAELLPSKHNAFTSSHTTTLLPPKKGNFPFSFCNK